MSLPTWVSSCATTGRGSPVGSSRTAIDHSVSPGRTTYDEWAADGLPRQSGTGGGEGAPGTAPRQGEGGEQARRHRSEHDPPAPHCDAGPGRPAVGDAPGTRGTRLMATTVGLGLGKRTGGRGPAMGGTCRRRAGPRSHHPQRGLAAVGARWGWARGRGPSGAVSGPSGRTGVRHDLIEPRTGVRVKRRAGAPGWCESGHGDTMARGCDTDSVPAWRARHEQVFDPRRPGGYGGTNWCSPSGVAGSASGVG